MYPIEKRTMQYLIRLSRTTEGFDFTNLLNAARPKTPQHMRAALEHLQSIGYLEKLSFDITEKNRPIRIELSLKGLEYTGKPSRDDILRWLTDHLIAILSLIVSIVALIFSVS